MTMFVSLKALLTKKDPEAFRHEPHDILQNIKVRVRGVYVKSEGQETDTDGAPHA